VSDCAWCFVADVVVSAIAGVVLFAWAAGEALRR
jgi:hypothetical protein